MVELAGIEPASATFNCRDSFTSLADFWLQQARLKKRLFLKGISKPYLNLKQLSVYWLLPPHASTVF